jgi:PAS domain S-box-containing protein
LCTEELNRRPSRPPDYETENRALVALVQALADSPRTILQALADAILELLKSDSAGISLLTKDEKRFYWPAIAGVWKPHIGVGTPRDFGPCGDVLDRNIPLMFRHVERRYNYFLPVKPAIEECLLVPFYVNGKAVGTIWAIAHSDCRKFDVEDMRQLVNLGRFTSSAYRVIDSLDLIENHVATLRENEYRSREMIDALPAAIYTTDVEGRILHFNRACIELSGRTPVLGSDYWCVSWKLYRPDGTPLPHDECPMAIALKEGRAVRDQMIIVERPDGTRVLVMPYPTPLRDRQGKIVGGISRMPRNLRRSAETFTSPFPRLPRMACGCRYVTQGSESRPTFSPKSSIPLSKAAAASRGNSEGWVWGWRFQRRWSSCTAERFAPRAMGWDRDQPSRSNCR